MVLSVSPLVKGTSSGGSGVVAANDVLRRVAFTFTEKSIQSFGSYGSIILLMPVNMSTAFDSITMSFSAPGEIGRGRLGLFMEEDYKFDFIDCGLFLSSPAVSDIVDTGEVTISGGDSSVLYPWYAGKPGATGVSNLRCPGQTVEDLLICNRGSSFVESLKNKLNKSGPTEEEKNAGREWGPPELFLGFKVEKDFPCFFDYVEFSAVFAEENSSECGF